MKSRRVVVAAPQSFRVRPRAVALTARATFGAKAAGVSVTLATPALHLHVLHVVLMCAEKKMVGANARAHIATVQDKQARRERPVSQFVTDTLRLMVSSVAPKCTVALWELPASPQPAAIRFIHPRPESFLRFPGWLRSSLAFQGHIKALLFAENTPALCYLGRPSEKASTTLSANTCDAASAGDRILFGHGMNLRIGRVVARLVRVFSAPRRAVSILARNGGVYGA